MVKYSKILLYLFCIIPFVSFSQDGFDVIRKAEKKYLQQKYSRALSLLNDAEEMDFGFCGNAWGEANRKIYLLRANIYMETKDYQLARNSLDSIYEVHYDDNLDSITLLSYIHEIGKDSLAKMIDSSLLRSEIRSIDEFECYLTIPLTDNVNKMRFKINLLANQEYFSNLKNKVELKKIWIQNFLKSSLFRMIKS